MNYEQKQKIAQTIIDFKARFQSIFIWNLGCAVISWIMIMVFKTDLETDSTLIIGLFFTATMFTLAFAIDGLRTLLRNYTPWTLGYLCLIIASLLNNGLQNAAFHLAVVFATSAGIMLVDIIFAVLAYKAKVKEISEGVVQRSFEESFQSFDCELMNDIEKLKDKHNIKDIRVFVD